MSAQWFSAMLRSVVLAENDGAIRLARSVVVFRAEDFEAARRRAVELGRASERSYLGGTGEQIRCRLLDIETLDLLGDTITDGREVYSEPADLPADMHIPFDAVLDPEASSPTHSGV